MTYNNPLTLLYRRMASGHPLLDMWRCDICRQNYTKDTLDGFRAIEGLWAGEWVCSDTCETAWKLRCSGSS